LLHRYRGIEPEPQGLADLALLILVEEKDAVFRANFGGFLRGDGASINCRWTLMLFSR
jgi:hypothetical protein